MTRAAQIILIVGVIIAGIWFALPWVPKPPVIPATVDMALPETDAQRKARADAALANFQQQRPALLAQVKKLTVEKKYSEAMSLGGRYAFAHDRDFDAAVQVAIDRSTAIQMAKARAEAKKRGVSIGMSKQDALNSSWGRPNRVNTTTTAFGEHEQWVYDRSYLYFTDGVLTSIQN